MNISVKAPGSLMIFGEHSVIHGETAIVAAIDQYIEVSVAENNQQQLCITSDRFPSYTAPMHALSHNKPYTFIIDAVKKYRPYLTHGLNVAVKSDFSPQIGLGSSAAVVSCILGALMRITKGTIAKSALFAEGLSIIRKQHPLASGSDLAASIHGNVIHFDPNNHHSKTLAKDLPLVVVYSGSKALTHDCVAMVNARFANNPDGLKRICYVAGRITEEAAGDIVRGDYRSLGGWMNVFDALIYKSFDLQTPVLCNILRVLRTATVIYGAKISGAGMGDCVVAVCTDPAQYAFPLSASDARRNIRQLALRVSNLGTTEII